MPPFFPKTLLERRGRDTFDVDYAVKVENIGDEELELAGIIDLLPTGFNFDSINPGGDITEAPSQLHIMVQVNRERVT